MPITWSPSAGLYLRDGEVVLTTEVWGMSWRSLDSTSTATQDRVSGVYSGRGTAAELHEYMRSQMKDEYIRQYTLARGGREQMTQADWGSVGGSLVEQYKRLPDFIDKVANGEYTEAQARNYARMYINSGREAYERGYRVSQTTAGATEMQWVLDPSVENCEGCVGFAEMGWVLISSDAYHGAYPGSGDTPCLTSCYCRIEYR